MTTPSSALEIKDMQHFWEQHMKSNQDYFRGLSNSQLEIAREMYMIGMRSGQDTVVQCMKEIYYNDPCLFESYFEDDEDDY